MTEVPDNQTGLSPDFPQKVREESLPRFTGTETFYDMSHRQLGRLIGPVRAERSKPDNPFNELARWFVHVVEQNGGSMPADEARQIVAEGYGIPFDQTWYGIAEAKDSGRLEQTHNYDPLTLPAEKARAEIGRIFDGGLTKE